MTANLSKIKMPVVPPQTTSAKSTAGTAPLLVVPFPGTKLLTLIAVFDNPLKSDLDAADPPRIPLTSDETRAVGLLNGFSTSTLQKLMRSELMAMAQGLGVYMYDLFRTNHRAGASITFGPGSKLTSKVEGTSGFDAVHNKASGEFDAALKRQYASGKVNVHALEATTKGTTTGGRRTLTNPAGLTTQPIVEFSKTELALHAVIGGQFQGGSVSLKSFSLDATTGQYRATLLYTLLDHFGVDNSDTVFDGFHGTLGQKAFWLLQHRRHPGHNPYVTTVVIEREVTGKLKP